MSNAIRYDSLLVHYLARELHDRLSGRRLRGVRIDPEQRRFTIEADDERLIWELHPTRGGIRIDTGPAPAGPATGGGATSTGATATAVEGWGGRDIRIQRRARVRRVEAPPDERWIEIEIDAGGPDRAARFVIELMTNQWNVLALDPAGRILAVLWPREAGDRPLLRGRPYERPGGREPRAGVDEPVDLRAWADLLRDIPPAERRWALVRALAWTSTLNAAPLLGDAAGDGAGDGARTGAGAGAGELERAWERYSALASRPEARPRLLELDRIAPYPLPLPGVPDRPATSLLAALETAATEEAPAALAPEVRSALVARRDGAARRAARLHEEAETAPGRAAKLRRQADLLMGQLHTVTRGADRAELDDFAGGHVSVELDPKLTAVENAEKWYDRARKRERAAERLPARVREAVAERNRLDSLLEALDSGDADPAEVERWIRQVRPAQGGDADDEDRLPYRSYRSSGGLEIRVGRSGKGNDALTFHHSSPDDLWLHARDAAGAHVILRWPDRDANPPKRDLTEAAILAALHSRARTSGTVPVDWTRRKYVRKPRKAPPGAVLPDRVETVFVEPDPAVEERLRPRR